MLISQAAPSLESPSAFRFATTLLSPFSDQKDRALLIPLQCALSTIVPLSRAKWQEDRGREKSDRDSSHPLGPTATPIIEEGVPLHQSLGVPMTSIATAATGGLFKLERMEKKERRYSHTFWCEEVPFPFPERAP